MCHLGGALRFFFSFCFVWGGFFKLFLILLYCLYRSLSDSNSIQADALITAASTLVLAILNSLTVWFYFHE